MQFNLQRVQANVRAASTLDLLDRATIYRANLEPAAVPVILEELRTRGVSAEALVAYEQMRVAVICDESGSAMTCRWCSRPAVTREWGMHRLFGIFPVFPRQFYLCDEHRDPDNASDAASGTN